MAIRPNGAPVSARFLLEIFSLFDAMLFGTVPGISSPSPLNSAAMSQFKKGAGMHRMPAPCCTPCREDGDLYGDVAPLAGPDSDNIFQLRDEDLAVADLA
jgi:hypothetical protein